MAIVLVVFWYATKRPARHTPISGEAPSPASSAATSARGAFRRQQLLPEMLPPPWARPKP